MLLLWNNRIHPSGSETVIFQQHNSAMNFVEFADWLLHSVAQLDFLQSYNNGVTQTWHQGSGYDQNTFKLGVVTSQLDAPWDKPRSFVRSRVGDPFTFGVGIPSALTHSLGSPLGASSLLGNTPRLAGSIISLIIRQSPHNVPDYDCYRLEIFINIQATQ